MAIPLPASMSAPVAAAAAAVAPATAGASSSAAATTSAAARSTASAGTVIRWRRRRLTIAPVVRPQGRELEPYSQVLPRPSHEGLDRL